MLASLRVTSSFVFAIVAVVFSESSNSHGAVLRSETFETNGSGSRYTVSGAGTPAGDGYSYFFRSQTNGSFLGEQGSWYFAGQDLNGQGGHSGFNDSATTRLPGSVAMNADSTGAVTLNTISITNAYNISVSLMVAAAIDNDNLQGFDLSAANGDKLSVQASIDGGTYFEVGRFQSLDTNKPMRELVSGTIINRTFSNWTFNIAGTGNTLSLRVVLRSTTPNENETIGFDNIVVSAEIVPEPSTASLAMLGIFGLMGMRKRMRNRR